MGKKETKLKLPSFEDDFSEWFNEVLFRAEIIDYRYNLKGCGVWLAHGFKLRRYILQIMRDLLESTPLPHEEYLFPMLIPQDQLAMEEETVKGFEDEVYWVTHGGLDPLAVKLALRPTSETVMYPMASLWIRSHADLPLKTYQIVNTFRYEGKNTRPLIRVREITTFKEAHTYHDSAEDAEKQIREAVNIYKSFFDALGVPYVVSSRPKWDTFPGANYTIAFDTIFPGALHRTLQVGTVHNLGQTFSKTYNIQFENEEGEQEFVYQTCYGVSERAIASVIATHGDDNGLKLPSSLAPIQVVVIPIIFKKAEDKVKDACKEFYLKIKGETSIRVMLDDRDISSARKFYDWEMKGVPLRVEIGPRDLEKGNVCLVRRDKEGKERKIFISQNEAIAKINALLKEISDNLWESAKNRHQEFILRTDDLQEAFDFVENNKGIVEIPFCGKEDCAAYIEQCVEGLQFLGVPEDYLPALNDTPKVEKDKFCAHCSEPVTSYWRMGRSY